MRLSILIVAENQQTTLFYIIKYNNKYLIFNVHEWSRRASQPDLDRTSRNKRDEFYMAFARKFSSPSRTACPSLHFGAKIQDGCQNSRANARNVRLYYPYWQYTDLSIFRFVSPLCLRSTLRLTNVISAYTWSTMPILVTISLQVSITIQVQTIHKHFTVNRQSTNILQ